MGLGDRVAECRGAGGGGRCGAGVLGKESVGGLRLDQYHRPFITESRVIVLFAKLPTKYTIN